jgi:L-seryl-tRNA(Ser) seleniumtransferase
VPVLELAIDRAVAPALEVSARLQRGDPPVHLSERFAGRNALIVDPQVLAPADDALVIAAVKRALTG